MRVLLDECRPRRLKHELPRHQVSTVPEMGWAGKQNGELLELARHLFDVFVTIDRGFVYQQNLSQVDIAVVLLVAPGNRLAVLQPLMTEVDTLLESIQAGTLVRVGA